MKKKGSQKQVFIKRENLGRGGQGLVKVRGRPGVKKNTKNWLVS